MSQVRMCDKCGNLFSENSEGWQTFTATRREKTDHGFKEITEYLDACADCSLVGTVKPVIRPELEK